MGQMPHQSMVLKNALTEVFLVILSIVLLGEHTNKFFLSKSWHDYDFGTMIFGKENLSIFAVYTRVNDTCQGKIALCTGLNCLNKLRNNSYFQHLNSVRFFLGDGN